jgi:hypothetical protein
MLNKSQIVCPKCQRADAVRKVSALVGEGTHAGETSGIAYVQAKHGLDVIPVVQTSVSRSALAAKLSPPKKPTKPSGYGCVGALLMTRMGLALVGSFLLLALFVCTYPFLMTLYQQNNLLFVAAIGLGLALIGIMGIWVLRSGWRDARSTREGRTTYEPRLEDWERAYARWQQLYYCQRDDGVFIPSYNTFVSVEQMQAYLYSTVKRKRDG